MDHSILEEVGLTKNEVKTYLTLLKLGPSNASAIISHTGINRGTLYDLLERLEKKGLVSHMMQKTTKVFEAVSPRRLPEMLREKEKKLNAILPELMNLSLGASSLDIKIYKGFEGIKTVFGNLMSAKPKELLVFGGLAHESQKMPIYITHAHERRIHQHIAQRALFQSNPSSIKRGEKLSTLPQTQIRYLPKRINNPITMNTYNNKVCFISYADEEHPFVICIENKDLATCFKQYFELL